MTAPTHGRTRPGRRPLAARTSVIFGGVSVGGARIAVIAPSGVGADVDHRTTSDPFDAGLGTRAQADDTARPPLLDLSGVSGGRTGAVAAAVARAAGVVVDGRADTVRQVAVEASVPVVVRCEPVVGRGESVDAGAMSALVSSVGAADAVVVGVEDPAAVAEVRRCVGVPVLVEIAAGAGVATAAAVAVAAGADAVWLRGAVTAADVAQAREAATRLAPLLRPVVPETLVECRDAIDGVDAAVATLLEHRVALAGRVQQLKPVGGYAGRDAEREAAIVRAMATRAPSLSRASLERVVSSVIEAGLDAAERDEESGPPVWRG